MAWTLSEAVVSALAALQSLRPELEEEVVAVAVCDDDDDEKPAEVVEVEVVVLLLLLLAVEKPAEAEEATIKVGDLLLPQNFEGFVVFAVECFLSLQ